tara:strand:+ start:1533 stop:1751 length:219 start_codon:yes stop_codon:yes gene_type:complete
MNKRYCSIKEVSEYTSLPATTLYEWASQGRMPSIKIGRRVLFDLKDIDGLMSKLKRCEKDIQEKTDRIIGEF